MTKKDTEQQSLGLKRGTIKLVPYNPLWALVYKNESAFLKSLFGRDFIASEHIGSTSVKGMCSKPVLDMMLALPSCDVLPQYQPFLEKAGYHRRDYTDEKNEHILFAKGDEACRTIYLKLTTKDSSFWKENLLFKNYLIKHKNVAAEYEKLKINLAAKAGENNRALYTKGKAAFILDVIKKAGFPNLKIRE